LVLSEVLVATTAGILAGLTLGSWGSLTLKNLLYGVQGGDWRTVAAAGVVMIAATSVAGAIPAIRVLLVSPRTVLTAE
jgi:uncharacterized membrane protein YjgN (DUF898 family)